MTMNPRGHSHPYSSNSLSIRQEIQRFESVHPSIYSIYDLIEAIPDPLIQQQIREHVVCIEDSFVNSQEWTLARAVPDLKLGILGTTNSGKSALVHRYLTGSYMQDESPEGGRFKKEVILDTQSYLLLIRDEGGPPEMQFTNWVDAVICVFSVENEMSFNAIYTYYTKMAHYRNLNEIPVILVGTQDAISESNPRVIDDTRARKLANDLKRCSYYETCATYGLNVERVFQDACQKIVQLRLSSLTPTNSRPSTPNHSSSGRGTYYPGTQGTQGSTPGPGTAKPGYDTAHSGSSTSGSGAGNVPQGHSPPFREQATPPQQQHAIHTTPHTTPHGITTTPHGNTTQGLGNATAGHGTTTTGRGDDKKRDKKRDKERERQREREQEQATMAAMIQSQLNQAAVAQQAAAYHGHHAPLPPPTTAPPPPPTAAPAIDHIQQEMFLQQQQLATYQQQVLDFREMTTPSSTPVPSRKTKGNTVQKSNSFSGSAILQRASGIPGEFPDPAVLVTRTPQPHRKNKNTKSLSPDAGPEIPQTGLTPLMNRKEPRYRFSLIVDKMDSFLRELPRDSPLTPILSRIPRVRSSLSLDQSYDFQDLPTPSSTPTPGRKNRRRSNLFSKKAEGEDGLKKTKNGETVGSGRVIPIKQGYLYKKSAKPLSKDWKKKYVTLLDDGRLTYHPSLHDYMDDVHGKEIRLMKTTVKIPGQKPRGSRTTSESVGQPNGNVPGKPKDGVVLTSFDQLRDGPPGGTPKADESVVIPNPSIQADPESGVLNGMDLLTSVLPGSKIETPNVKKRHKRAKSGAKNLDTSQDGADSDGYEFMIVSIENKQWHFEACSIEEREEWVTSIEQQILFSLQGIESNKSKSRSNTLTDPAAGQAIRQVKGNAQCADCDANNPDWASLNLGALICIECSGIHRNLGTHLSRVRSLDLDEWPPELVEVMKGMGNQLSNSIWEANTKGRPKPTPSSPREDKEKFVRAKYELKEFLPAPPHPGVSLPQQLIDAVARQHTHDTALVLAHSKPDHVNAPYSATDTRTALHIAAALGNVVLVQLLLWYGANMRTVDHEGRNALFYARSSSSTECVDLLKSQGCPENPTLPRRRSSNQPVTTTTPQLPAQQPPPPQQPAATSDSFEKLPASVI